MAGATSSIIRENDFEDELAESMQSYNRETADKLALTRTESVKPEPEITAPPHSRFSRSFRTVLIAQCAFTGFFSTIAGAIYYPVLSVIERKFDIDEELVNVTVVVYFVFQGLAPTFMGGFADSLGRRPVVLVAIVIYFGACIGLACAQTYAQIIVLRCIQAAGISPVIAINSGIMGDVTTRAERGGYVGYVAGFQVLGSAFGALIGAGLSSRWGWRAIFWFLAIGSGICFLASFLILPETKRNISGNGSVTPKSYLNRAPILVLPTVRKSLHLDNPDYETLELPTQLNLLAPFKILKAYEICILMLVAGLQFAMYTTHLTALSTALSKQYHLTVAKVGLCYLPSGICTLCSIVIAGRYLNWNYRRRLKYYQNWLGKKRSKLLEEHDNDLNLVQRIIENDPKYTFNIFKARLQPAFVTLLLSSSGFCAYGWCITVKAPLAAVLCMSGFASLFSNCILAFSTTLIVDLFPTKTSTATGCLNLFRCILSAVFIAALSKMVEKMKFGGVFTFLGALTSSSSILLFILLRKGKELAFKRKKQELGVNREVKLLESKENVPFDRSTTEKEELV
ncbi:Qdr2p [Saccharomyces cerevisiae EC1118]|uniref:Qdr2p n=1 Tax=Saccharomyces cerevisiae (strain Lalvin EC1118 / Prise de mousse) TaxID=643680 RepID=C8ZAC3_YEAS8|nr:Qdr2p [Saccharomyces cerevisiae EC1118]